MDGQRNLASFLELVQQAKVALDPVISRVLPFADAEAFYDEIRTGRTTPLGVVLDYGDRDETQSDRRPIVSIPSRPIKRSAGARIRLGCIGAGNYASSMLLPVLKKHTHVELRMVATATGLSAENARRKFGFERVTTQYEEVLAADDIDAVIIATRHSSHARLVADALRAGKATYVEKPLAISFEDLEQIRQAILESSNDRLLVGFNRRFAPMIEEIGRRFGRQAAPLVGHYRVHAGRLDAGAWYLDGNEGSRFVGEAGHFFDVLARLIPARPRTVVSAGIRPCNPTSDDLENLIATVEYEDGSVGSVTYLTQGAAQVEKEYFEIFGGGRTAQLYNFREPPPLGGREAAAHYQGKNG